MDVPKTLDELIETVKQRRSRSVYGIKTADRYLSEINACLNRRGPCPLRTFGDNAPEQWADMLKEAEHKLVYAARGAGIDRKSIVKNGDEDDEDRGPVLMTFEAIVTSARKDRDGDVLDTRGARVDPNMPLLWQHITIQPIGKYVRTVLHTDELLKARFELADLPLGNDAAVLIEMGALRISHGFIPDMDEMQPMERGGFYFGAFDIYEASLVSVPSNIDAVITAYSRKQLKTGVFRRWAKRYYDKRKKVFAKTQSKKQRLAKDSAKENGKAEDLATKEALKKARKRALEILHEAESRRKPCEKCKKQKMFLPMVAGVEGSWEWTTAHLQAGLHEYMEEAGVLPEDGWCELIATWNNRALVATIGPDRPWLEDEVYRCRWAYDEETNSPRWVGEPTLAEIAVTVRERAIELASRRGFYKGYLRRARTPSFNGIEETPWSKPTLSDYRAGLDLPDGANWEDLTKAQKQRIVSHTLIGDANAETFAEANAFPVVNPRTGKLNANALRNAIARAPQANIPEETATSIQTVARRLLDQNFREERSYDVLEKDLYFAAMRESWRKVARTSDNLSLLADALERDAERKELERVLFE